MGNYFEILNHVKKHDLERFVTTFNSNGNFDNDLIEKVSKKLVGPMPLGFCRRLSIFFTFDQQKIARKVAEVAKIYFDDLNRAMSVKRTLSSVSGLNRGGLIRQISDFRGGLIRQICDSEWPIYRVPSNSGIAGVMAFSKEEIDNINLGYWIAGDIK